MGEVAGVTNCRPAMLQRVEGGTTPPEGGGWGAVRLSHFIILSVLQGHWQGRGREPLLTVDCKHSSLTKKNG